MNTDKTIKPTVKLYCGDCLKILPKLAAGSIDAVVTDPPYGQTNEKYDSDVAFGAIVWRECLRAATDKSALVSFAGSPTYHRIATAIETGGWKVRQMWGWVYRNGLMTSAWPREGFDRLSPAFDPIAYATKGKILLHVNREGTKEWRRKRNADDPCTWSTRSGHRAAAAAGRWPRTLISQCDDAEFSYFALNPNNPRLRREKTGHPNQKPIELLDWILTKLPCGTVLDPFMGSGTTGIAAMRAGLNFIGVEIDRGYYNIAKRRIAEARSSLPTAHCPLPTSVCACKKIAK